MFARDLLYVRDYKIMSIYKITSADGLHEQMFDGWYVNFFS